MKAFGITLLALLISGPTLSQRRDIGPMPGDPAPDFSLSTRNGNKQVTLSKLTDRPTVLIFASYT